MHLTTKSRCDCSAVEKDVKQELESLCHNDAKGPSFSEKTSENRCTLNLVYHYGVNFDSRFNATEKYLTQLFKKDVIIDRVRSYSRDKVMVVVLNSTSSHIPLSMSQEV